MCACEAAQKRWSRKHTAPSTTQGSTWGCGCRAGGTQARLLHECVCTCACKCSCKCAVSESQPRACAVRVGGRKLNSPAGKAEGGCRAQRGAHACAAALTYPCGGCGPSGGRGSHAGECGKPGRPLAISRHFSEAWGARAQAGRRRRGCPLQQYIAVAAVTQKHRDWGVEEGART